MRLQLGSSLRNGDPSYHRIDVRDPVQVMGFIEAGEKRFGKADVHFKNAGIFMKPGQVHASPSSI